ncbi:MAG: hypothetical protein H3C62_17545 [Gemmatimonadaceae bacterium]|nr:hypothetical protein [Gemmatimonadaceae bacterium]
MTQILRQVVNPTVGAHTHHPDDLVGTRSSDYEAAGDLAGYAFAISRLRANSAEVTCPDGGAATAFYSLLSGTGLTRLLVVGDYNSTDVFCDEVVGIGYGGFGVFTVATHDVFGAPGARTYSLSGGNICVAIAGGGPVHNYSVRFVTTEFDT